MTRPTLGQRAGYAAAAFALAVTMLGTTLPTPLYVLYGQRFGFSELMITVIFATYAAGVIASLLRFGHLSDQVGRRRMLVIGEGLLAQVTGLRAARLIFAAGVAALSAGVLVLLERQRPSSNARTLRAPGLLRSRRPVADRR